MNEKPLVSFVILAYNQEPFISEAIKGALSQTYDNIEIIVSDDCSSDDTYEVARQTIREYKGEKKVSLYRNEKNLGLVPHVNKIFSQYVTGEYIALAGGDDISLPDRIKNTVATFSDESVAAVCGQSYLINKKGDIISETTQKGFVFWKINDEYVRSLSFMTGGAGLAIKRRVFDVFGELKQKTPTEDSTLRFRSLLLGKLVVSADYYIKYRRHDNNLTNRIYALKTEYIAKQYLADIKTAYCENLINRTLYKRLRRKVYLYRLNRSFSEYKNGRIIFIRMPLRLMQEVIKKMIQWV